MKKIYYYVTLTCLFIASCSDDANPIDAVFESDRGAVLRTVVINSGEFELGNPDSAISIEIEEQDVEDGNLLDQVNVFVAYRNETTTTNETLVQVFERDEFTAGGAQGLPRITLDYSLSTFLDALEIPISALACQDQMLIRLELVLTDGRVLSEDDLTAIIAGEGTFFNSPFCYAINSVVDGPFGPTFVPPGLVEITNGHSNTVRNVTLTYTLAEPQVSANFEFSIVCDEVVVTKFLFAGEEAVCAGGGALLFGPDTVNATVNPNDDSVFEVQFVEGFRGFDGECNFGTVSSRIRFSRQ